MTQKRYIPLCWYCKHFDNDAWKEDFRIRRCSAFPEAIPDAIWADYFNHLKPYDGDNGIRFEKAEHKALLERFGIQRTGFNSSNIHKIDAVIERYLLILEAYSQDEEDNKKNLFTD